MSTFDERISQALNRAIASLHAHLEADFSALTQELVAAADEARQRAAADAAETTAAAERHQAEKQLTQAKEDARAQVTDVRASMQMQIDEARRTLQDKMAEAERAADTEVTALRKKATALEAELDLARQAQVDLKHARAEITQLKTNTHALAEDVVVAQVTDLQAAADQRTAAEVERAQTDAHQAELAAAARLVDGIRAIDVARSLGDALTALAVGAGREVDRAAVLIVKGSTLRGWRFSGFSSEMKQQPGAFMLSGDDAGIAGAVAAKRVAETTTTDAALPPFARGAGARHAAAIPIAVGGDVVAVLYADALRSDAPSSAARWPAVLEVLTRHASRTLEALTVQQAAGLGSSLPPLSPSRVPFPGPVERGNGDGDAARRYARLLVSEIRMFHEPVVDAGRRGRDLRARLGGEIDRARRLYEQRIPAAVRQTADYFEQELVRTLADGDRTLLG